MSDLAGASGPCRSVRGSPLFSYLRAVQNCAGSKIDHLLRGGPIWHKRVNFEIFIEIIKRLLRDKPMPASEFQYAVSRLAATYRIRDVSFRSRGMFDFYACSNQIIGDVRLVDGEIVCIRNNDVAMLRNVEFKKPKYKKMPLQQVEFLKSLFELVEYSNQLAKAGKWKPTKS